MLQQTKQHEFMNCERRVWTHTDTLAIAGVVGGALFVRLAFVLTVHPAPVSDFGWYYAKALDIVHGLGYTSHGYPTAYWPPGWPYFLAGVVWLFGPSLQAAEIVQAVLNACTAGVVFLIGRAIAGTAQGLAGGIAYALLPSAVEWSATLASEPIYTLLWALATYIWLSQPTSKTIWYVLSGLLLGAAALVRPSALLFWIILLVYLLTLGKERRRPARIVSSVGVTAICTLLVVTPLIVRNYHVFHTLVVVSNNGGVSLYQGNNPRAGGGYAELSDPLIAKLISDPRTEVQGDKLAAQMAMQYIKSHPLHEVWLAVRRVYRLYASDDLAIRFTFRSHHFREVHSPPPSDRIATAALAINTAVYYGLMVFAIAGIALSIARARRDSTNPRWRLVLGMILYNTAIFATIFGLDRYRYPTMPYFAAFAGIGLVAMLAYIQERLQARVQLVAKPE